MGDQEIVIDGDLKDRLKQNRLTEYQRRIFECRMDLEAARANADDQLIKMNEDAIASLTKAYRAVEVM